MSEEKKDTGESVQETVLWTANYDRENNDYKDVLRPRRFKWRDFSTNFMTCSICSTLSTCLVFFPKHYFNKLYSKLPQNITWTDE